MDSCRVRLLHHCNDMKSTDICRHKIFLEYWKDRTDYKGIAELPLFSHFQHVDFDSIAERGMTWDWKVEPMTTLQYGAQMMAWVRATWTKEPNGGFDGVEHFMKHVLLFDVKTETWAAETLVGWDGQGLLDVLTTRLDEDPESEKYKIAYEVTWRLLTKTISEKFTHAKNLTHTPATGALLDRPENADADRAPGTFAELLRYGSVHFEQTRETVDYIDPVPVDPKWIIHKGLLEP